MERNWITAFDDPIVWIMIIGFIVLVVYGIFFVARLLYKANRVLDMQLKQKQQEKTSSQSPDRENPQQQG